MTPFGRQGGRAQEFLSGLFCSTGPASLRFGPSPTSRCSIICSRTPRAPKYCSGRCSLSAHWDSSAFFTARGEKRSTPHGGRSMASRRANCTRIVDDRIVGRHRPQYAAPVLDIRPSNYLDQRAAVGRQRNRHCACLPELAEEATFHRNGARHGRGAFAAPDLRDDRVDADVAPLRKDCRGTRALLDRGQIARARRKHQTAVTPHPTVFGEP